MKKIVLLVDIGLLGTSHAVSIQSQNSPFLSFSVFGICSCFSFGIVEFMTDRAYADHWTCVVFMQSQ